MQDRFDKMLLLGHFLAFLPIAIWVLLGFLMHLLGDHFNYNDDLAGYTGPGQVIHGGEWMFPWSTPACLISGLVALIIGWKRRKAVTVLEGLWCFLAAFVFFQAYPIYVRFL